MNNILDEALKFKKKYPTTVAFRINAHATIAKKHLDADEELKYVFVGQKNDTNFSVPNSFLIALTNKRMLFARKRLLYGYLFYAVTPDMLNDVKIRADLIWGKIVIDTVKELVTISNLSRNCLDEIETAITKYMIDEKVKKDSIK